MTAVSHDGDTVRRPAGPWTDSVHALLRHVRERGVDCVPEPLGRDGLDRDVVSFVEGVVPAYPLPAWVWHEEVLAAAPRLLRRVHGATAGFTRAGRHWQSPAHEPDEVVCHNDFAPYNLVFRDGVLAGVIDFEHASPGPRAWDLAYLAYRLVPLTAPSHPDVPSTAAGLRAARLARLCAAYGDGGPTPAAVLDLAPARLDELAAFTRGRAAGGAPDEWAEHVAVYEADAAYVREEREALLGRD